MKKTGQRAGRWPTGGPRTVARSSDDRAAYNRERMRLFAIAAVLSLSCSATGPESPEVAMAEVEGVELLAIGSQGPPPLTLVVSEHQIVLMRGTSLTLDPQLELARVNPRQVDEHLITDLHEALSAWREQPDMLTRTLADSEFTRQRPDALVILDPEVKTSLLIDVIYTCGRAELDFYEFAVATPGGPRALLVVPPRFCSTYSRHAKRCIRPQFLLGSDGVFATTTHSDSDGCASTTAEDVQPLIGSDGGCPVRRDDFATLGALLDALPGPACRTARFSAEGDVEWAELAKLAAWLDGERQFLLELASGEQMAKCVE
jgi:hypothetical protein